MQPFHARRIIRKELAKLTSNKPRNVARMQSSVFRFYRGSQIVATISALHLTTALFRLWDERQVKIRKAEIETVSKYGTREFWVMLKPRATRA